LTIEILVGINLNQFDLAYYNLSEIATAAAECSGTAHTKVPKS